MILAIQQIVFDNDSIILKLGDLNAFLFLREKYVEPYTIFLAQGVP